ncbi:hypothetical protein HIM_08970 [Hirsutella minnesotensis 3608]|uniref:Isotrichodermin C-15 hydroxylase n=1 Tax=Hirsutella minnesotensis 3608 TaxID=1043627 RepID=A0A0F7ZSN2_9HYPO|nr:hypothetical protein HIM_08970 [Hirsutella minnesotensis 3608]
MLGVSVESSWVYPLAWIKLLLSSLVVSLTRDQTIAYVIYQVTFHPLAKYPGPFIAKLTSLYSVYHAARGDRHSDLYRLHQKHGSFVRFGPNHVSILSASALEQIYGHQANVQKGSWYSVYYGISIFNAIDKNVHARKKRVMAQAFSDRAVRGMEPHILSAIRDWCAALGDNIGNARSEVHDAVWSTPKDLAHWAAYMIFDVLGEICYGETFRTSLGSDNRYFLDLMVSHVRFLNIIGQMSSLKYMKLGTILMRGSRERRQNQIAFSQRQLRKRLDSSTSHTKNRRDIIYYLQEARDPETGQGYSEPELIYETTLLLGAGSDTANTALASIFYFLVHHPDVLQRLTATIRDSFPDVEAIASGPLLNSMTYLRACIDESLRLCPPVPMPLPRQVLSGGLIVDGHFFRQGYTVGVPTYSLHHSEQHFQDPFKFDPKRWLVRGAQSVAIDEGRSLEEVSRAREAFAPFSIGPRACIGRGVALLELHVGVARALWLYDIRIAPGHEKAGVGPQGEYKIKDHFIVGKEGPVVQFRRATRS